MVAYEFSHGNMINPCFRVGTTEDAEVGLHFLVESFCFSISLRVMGGIKGNLISKDVRKFFGEVCSELRTMIGYDFIKKSKVGIEFSENDGSNAIGSDSLLCRAENYPLTKSMVYHNQEGIKAIGYGESSNEII